MTTLVAALSWVPRGYAAEEPKKFVLDDEEYQRISKLAQLQLDDAREDALGAQKPSFQKQVQKETAEEEDDLKVYNLDTYDENSDEDEAKQGSSFGLFSNVKGLSFHNSNEEDPYITLKDDAAASDDEREELQILPTDNLIVAAKTEEDISSLEIYVYESTEDNIYVHHDIMLPALPLCVEWLNYNPNTNLEDDGSRRGNMVAVGTFDPDIEIWDLDVIESVYPDAILGQSSKLSTAPSSKKKDKKKKKRKVANEEFHVDAVMCLAANRLQRNLLLSGSADTTIKLWDLQGGSTDKCAKSFGYHKDKVSAVEWHPKEAFYALTGGYDRIVVAADFRTAQGQGATWKFNSDVEGLKWDPHDSNYFYVSTDDGILYNYDIRTHSTSTTQKPIWLLQAHDTALSTFDISPTHPNLLVTGSTDHLVKLWHVQNGGPRMVLSRDLDLGKVFSTRFGPDSEVAMRVAVAGSTGSVKVWDLSTSTAARKAFGVSGRAKDIVEDGKVVGVLDEGDEEEEEDREEGGEGWEDMDDD